MTRITDAWISKPAPRAVMSALDGQAFFVGGCVRNALMGLAISDIDIATPLEPEDVQARLTAADIKSVPTGLKHGTQTAVIDGEGIEVTTFRADVATDGRHAQIAFTQDIEIDAARRDFTMNALYADRDGSVIDPLGGLGDLNARCVRFIGRAEDRIREDYLRILRFFRFHAWYGADGIDPDGLAACAELVDGIDRLARERIGWEFRKLLAAADPAPATASMAAGGILMRCLPGASPTALAPLVHLEGEHGVAPNWMTRLMALGGEDLAGHLRLSRAEEREAGLIRQVITDGSTAMAAGYRHGADIAIAASLVLAASSNGTPPDGFVQDARHGAEQTFPLEAADLLQSGMTPGPELGAALKRAEDLWVASDFTLGKAALIEQTLSGH